MSPQLNVVTARHRRSVSGPVPDAPPRASAPGRLVGAIVVSRSTFSRVALAARHTRAERLRGRRRWVARRPVRPAREARHRARRATVPHAESLSDYMEKVRHLSARPVRSGTSASRSRVCDPRLSGGAAARKRVLPTAENHLRVAQEYRRLGMLDTAYARLNRAVQQDPQLAEAHERWRGSGATGDSRIRVSGPPIAPSTTTRDRRAPENTLGTILDALGQTRRRATRLRAGVSLDPTAAWAFNNLCYLELRSAVCREARARCEAALRLEPDADRGAQQPGADVCGQRRPRPARARNFWPPAIAATAALQPGHRPHRRSRLRRGGRRVRGRPSRREPTFTAAKARAHEAADPGR